MERRGLTLTNIPQKLSGCPLGGSEEPRAPQALQSSQPAALQMGFLPAEPQDPCASLYQGGMGSPKSASGWNLLSHAPVALPRLESALPGWNLFSQDRNSPSPRAPVSGQQGWGQSHSPSSCWNSCPTKSGQGELEFCHQKLINLVISAAPCPGPQPAGIPVSLPLDLGLALLQGMLVPSTVTFRPCSASSLCPFLLSAHLTLQDLSFTSLRCANRFLVLLN